MSTQPTSSPVNRPAAPARSVQGREDGTTTRAANPRDRSPEEPTSQAAGTPSTLVEAFAEQVALRPGATAFTSEGVAVTYAELDAAANRLANLLRAHRPGRGEPVGLVLDQGLDCVTALLAVLKTGNFYIPLDPEQPEERLAKTLAAAGCSLVLGNEQTRPLCAAVAVGPVRFLPLAEAAAQPAQWDGPPVAPTDLAYVIFTSGSTGEPKGVAQNHKSVLNSTRLFGHYFDIGPEDRQSLLYTPAVFGAQRDIFNALLHGARLCHYPLRTRGLLGLAEWIDAEAVTVYCSVASVFRRMVQALPPGRTFGSVRLVKCGGEATYWEDVDRFCQHFRADCRLFCGFSMTETNLVTSSFVQPDQARNGPRVPIGRPVPGKEILILDAAGNPVPDGEVGELTIRSEFISPGYLGESAERSARFRSDPSRPGLIEFRTGDLARLTAEGGLEHCGRSDAQVKIRGFRVDLVEIEQQLQSLPALAEAAVAVQEFKANDFRLVAYLVFRPRAETPVVEIGRTLESRLPSHMCPSHYVVMQQLPQTANGKLDRKRLPRVELVQRADPASYVAPEGPLETCLVECWERCLGVGGVGVTDDYFSIGGDSLSAAQLLLDIHDRFGVALEAAEVMGTASTVRGMAAEIAHRNPHWERAPARAPGEAPAAIDIDFADFNAKLQRTNMPELYYVDRATGLRRAKPGASFGAIAINSLGFRGPEIPVDKPQGTLRVAFLGSSGTFDPFATSNEKTWCAQACEELRRLLPGVRLDYVNAGLNGYDAKKVGLQYRNFVSQLAPDIVVICLNDINGPTGRLARKLGLYSGVHYRETRLFRTWPLLGKIEKKLVIGWRLLFAFSDRGKLTAPAEEVLRDSAQGIEALVRECQAAGSRVLLVENGRQLRESQTRWQQLAAAASQVYYLPYLSIPGYLKLQREQIRILADIALRNGCNFRDLSCEVPGTRRYWADSSHFTDQGSAVFGKAVGRELLAVARALEAAPGPSAEGRLATAA